MSFYFFFSIIPCIVLGTAFAGLILSSRAVTDFVMKGLHSMMPGLDIMAGDFIMNVVSQAKLLGWIGTISLLWVGGYIFDITEYAVAKVWKVKNPRNWITRRLFSIIMVVLSGTLFTLSSVVSMIITALRMFSVELPELNVTLTLKNASWLWHGWLVALPFMLSLIMFTLIYKLSLGRAIPWRLAGAGGVLAATLFEGVKRPFIYYIMHFANYEKLYGALATMAILFVWVNISTCILLLGIEFAAAVKDSTSSIVAQSRMKFFDRT